MRVRGEFSPPRGEAARVAERVRRLLDVPADELVDEPADEPADEPPGPPPPARVSGWQRVLARLPVRLDPGRRAALGVGVAVLLAALVTGIWLMSSRPHAVPVSADVPSVPGSSLVGTSPAGPSSRTGVTPPASAAAAPASAAVVVVDVAGKVVHPGLYRLPTGSRVDDAIKAAGGARHGVDLSSLNLAAKISDGQQIAVGLPGAVGPAGAGGAAGTAGGEAGAGGAASGSGAGGAPVNLNTASADQLDTLPGVGPVLAQHILDWRTEHGRFTSVDQLNDVSGIGDVKFAGLRDLVAV